MTKREKRECRWLAFGESVDNAAELKQGYSDGYIHRDEGKILPRIRNLL